MTAFPAVSLPTRRQGKYFPCWRYRARETKSLIANSFAARPTRFRAGNKIFFLFFPCGRENRLGRRADRHFLDLVSDKWFVFAEIRLEAAGELAGGLVIGLLVGPGAARV